MNLGVVIDPRDRRPRRNRQRRRREAEILDRDLRGRSRRAGRRSEEHTSELQSRLHLVCRLLLEKKKNTFHHLGCFAVGPDTQRATDVWHNLVSLGYACLSSNLYYVTCIYIASQINALLASVELD